MSLRALFSRLFPSRPSRTLRGVGRATLVIAMVATLLAFILKTTLWSVDARLYDIGFSQGQKQKPADFIILGIDADLMRNRPASLAPRDQLAQLLLLVAKGHPAVVVMDVYLDSFLDQSPTKQDIQLRAALAAVKASGAAMLISDLSPEEMQGQRSGGNNLSQSGPTAHGGVLAFFRDATTASGSVMFKSDPDSVVRRTQPSGSLIPMPLLAARYYVERTTGKNDEKHWQDLATRLQHEDVPITFCGPPGTVDQLSAMQLLQIPLLASGLEGKLVFIGSTYNKGFDFLSTPYSSQAKIYPQWESMYGVELLAQTTQTLVQGAPRHSENTLEAQAFTALLTFLLSMVIAALAIRGTRRGVLASAIALVGTGVASILSARDTTALWGFRFHPVAQILIAIPLACAAAIAWREWHEARELHHVRGAFEAYVGPQVLKQLSGKMPELGGEVRPVTVLFCDIRGYSALAETMRDDPEALLRELNGHFSPLVGALQSRHAHVDNYVGDLIMALWCEPLSGRAPKQNAIDAVAAALDIERLVRERNEARVTEGLPPIEVGIGLHCGEAVVGNLGGQKGEGSKIHYTAIGDTVNLASRVESSTRQFNLPLLVTREIVEQCGDDAGFRWEFVAQTLVKGRTQTVDVFRVEAAPIGVKI